jgi:hypothetical protein
LVGKPHMKKQLGRYEGVSKSFRIGHLERELQMVHLTATRCSCFAVFWASVKRFATITLCVASQRVLLVVIYFVIDSVRKLLVTPSYGHKYESIIQIDLKVVFEDMKWLSLKIRPSNKCLWCRLKRPSFHTIFKDKYMRRWGLETAPKCPGLQFGRAVQEESILFSQISSLRFNTPI